MSNSTIIKIKRSQLQPGDIILGPAPRDRDLPLTRRPRPGYDRRASSVDRYDFPDSNRGRGQQIARRRPQQDYRDKYDHDYDSEGSIPPRSRRQRPRGQRQQRPRSDGDGNGKESSSSSSSDLGCSSDDEEMKKKAKWKKWGAIGLAGVATIHAVHGVHETVEKTRARRKEVAEGEIGLDEAHKKKNRGRWRDAANVGIAAVWLKSAYDEIQEYREAKHEHAEMIEHGEERHKKRVERAKAIQRGEYHGHHELDEDEMKKCLGRG